MALSAVSSGAYAVGLVLGRAAIPIAVDVITNMVLMKCKVPLNVRWSISGYPAFTAVYLTSGVPKWDAAGVITCSLYIAYKTLPWLPKTLGWGTDKPQEPTTPAVHLSSEESLRNKYHQLIEIVTVSLEGKDRGELDRLALMNKDEMRRRWQKPETIRLATALINEAAAAMHELYRDLDKATSEVPRLSRFEKMAELLTSQQGPEYYYRRFCCVETVTLLDIYRTVRGMGFFFRCPEVDGQLYRYNVVPQILKEEEDAGLFFNGKTHSEWRRIYNIAIDRFEPLMQVIRRVPESQRGENLNRYLNWAVRDDEKTIAKAKSLMPGAFHLLPGSKPGSDKIRSCENF